MRDDLDKAAREVMTKAYDAGLLLILENTEMRKLLLEAIELLSMCPNCAQIAFAQQCSRYVKP